MKKFSDIILLEGSSFDKVIEETIPEEKRKVSGTYKLPDKKSGRIKIHKNDIETFKKLFFLDGKDKTVGNGEISLYWVFNYKTIKSSGRAIENRGDTKPDLIIDKINCEVKSYPQKNAKINLGRFQSAREFRQLLSYVLGIDNLFLALDPKGKKPKFSSETNFIFKDLFEAMERVNTLNDILESNSELTKNFPIFKNIKKNIDLLYKSIGKGSSIEQAAALAKILIEFKVGKKPGDKGFVINLLPNKPTDIYAHYVDFDSFAKKTSKDFAELFAVSSAALKINFAKFS